MIYQLFWYADAAFFAGWSLSKQIWSTPVQNVEDRKIAQNQTIINQCDQYIRNVSITAVNECEYRYYLSTLRFEQDVAV